VFVLLQWGAVVLVALIGWELRPHTVEPPWKSDPIVSETLPPSSQYRDLSDHELFEKWRAAGGGTEKTASPQARLDPVTDPKILEFLNGKTPSSWDWATHVAYCLVAALAAYLAVFASWKTLDWVFKGFTSGQPNNR
jgi:hypothetical protein